MAGPGEIGGRRHPRQRQHHEGRKHRQDLPVYFSHTDILLIEHVSSTLGAGQAIAKALCKRLYEPITF